MDRKGLLLVSMVCLLAAGLLAGPRAGWAKESADGAAGMPLGSKLVIHDGAEVEVSPAVAYNSERQEYLAVWYNNRAGCDDVRAQRLSRTGAPAGGPFYIAAGCPAERRFPDVAYNSRRDEYLVVWVEEESGMSYIRGQRLRGDGGPEGSLITVVAGPIGMLDSYYPAVSHGFALDKYLVVWEYVSNLPPPGNGTDILGQIVSGAGAPEGGAITIAFDPGGEPREEPDVAYNRHANGHLVVWQQWDPGAGRWSVYGRLVNGDGGMPAGPFWISDYVVSCTEPAAAALPTAPGQDKFLVVWEIDSYGDRNIFGRMVAENGTPSSTYVQFQQGDGPQQSSPAVAADELGGRYLVAWRHPQGVVDVAIHARAVSAGGALQPGEAELVGPTADYPAVVAGPSGTFLVAWQDKAPWATHSGIYGQLWGNRVYLPGVMRSY